MQSKIFAILLAAMLVGCATKPTVVKTEVVVPPTFSDNIPIPKVEPIEIKEMKWKIMNKVEMQKFLAINNSSNDFIVYTIDDQNMALLMGNLQEMRRYIQSQQAKIDYLLGVIDARTKKGN